MASPIVIASAGVVTPVGLSLAETAASARAKVAMLREIEWRDRRFEPFIVGRVPDDGLPPLAPALAGQSISSREVRLLCLAQVAIEEVMAGVPADKLGLSPTRPLPVLLALPEHHTTTPIQPELFVRRLAVQTGLPLDIARSAAVPRGSAVAVMALREAANRLAQGGVDWVLVGGVDSLVDPFVLGTLDLEGRIRNEINNDGFSPAEGAGFLLLCSAETALRVGIRPLVQVLGAASGLEAGHLYAEDNYLGEGLAGAFASLFAATTPPTAIATVYTSFNGEHYWAREWGVSRLRWARYFEADHAIEHPAEVFGDLGAAHGAVMTAIAAQGVRQGTCRSPCLVYASSDHADRAVTLLASAASAP
jgi:3-oxoacyl-[acyl-carrier-protein] synthase-1